MDNCGFKIAARRQAARDLGLMDEGEFAHYSIARTWEKPTVFTIDNELLKTVLGPSVSCTGFGGGVRC